MRYFNRILTLVLVSILATSCASSDTKSRDENEPETLGETSLGDLLNSMGGRSQSVSSIFECIEESSDVDVRKGQDYTDEDYDSALPILNGLSEEGRQCAEEYKLDHATQIYRACITAGCGDGHSNGCDTIRPYLLNMGLWFEAAKACADTPARSLIGKSDTTGTEFDRIQTDIWVLLVPSGWTEWPRENGSLYFEAPNGKKGFYISTWNLDIESFTSPADAVESYYQTSVKALRHIEDPYSEVEKHFESDDVTAALVVDYYFAEGMHRIVEKFIAREGTLVRAAFHDYDCKDLDASRQTFDPIVSSLEFAD